MLHIVKRFFSATENDALDTRTSTGGHDARVAVCALFVEMAQIDETFTEEELQAIVAILTQRYGMSAADAQELMDAAKKELADSIDYWQFARLINRHYSTPEKIEVIEMLWEIVFVDGKMDHYENYLMHKLGELLRLSHKQLMDAKLKVMGQNRKSDLSPAAET